MCVGDTSFDLTFAACKAFFNAPRKKDAAVFRNITGLTLPEWDTNEERFSLISDTFVNLVKENRVEKVWIEGYAFGARGAAVFQIAENCGLLKHKLWKAGIEFDLVSPMSAKKFFSGKGNADKQVMYDAFTARTGVDLRALMSDTKKAIGSPVGDIVDAYAIMLTGHDGNYTRPKNF